MKIDPHSIVCILADLEACEWIQYGDQAKAQDVATYIADKLNIPSKRSAYEVREQLSKVHGEYIVELGNLNRRFAEARHILEEEAAEMAEMAKMAVEPKPMPCTLSELKINDTFVFGPPDRGAPAYVVVDTSEWLTDVKTLLPSDNNVAKWCSDTLVYPIDIVNTSVKWELKTDEN